MSHQQFYLQEGLTSEDLARTWNIVGKAAWDGLWRSAMGEISLAQFLTVMMCLVVELKSREGRADFDSTILENKGISADLLRRALLPISMGFRDMQAYLKARPARVNDLDLHPFEPSPLLRYPVMRMRGDRFMLYSRRLLEEAIRLIPWRVLRDQQDQALLRRYAVRFEKHIEQSLDEAGLRFVGEKALQDAFGAGKAVDFAVILNDVTLLIEVKSADLSSIGKATARPDTLRRDLKTSVLKGIAQGLSLTHTIRSRPGVMPDISRNKTYVLVVTYRDLNLMSSSQFWKSYAEDGVAKHLESEGVPLSTIPADRVFVCSAREFDTLMAALREQRLTFEDFLERAAFGNSNPTTTRHRLSMFLSAEEHPSQMLPHLRASVEMMGREGIRITEEEHAVSQRGPQSPGRA